ncbi:hypothetical protein OEZ85_011569 [Tetradesmus obliquus]|uniref:STI1/HOP DP domain-containing protein n=1 Tax=Tetradesmus obliquus TaxID=3088 RepID=A0ABY8TQS9_TETOB|nr:hypothetical protein OEZ85_011569 [Tetradesmus obliquus]
MNSHLTGPAASLFALENRQQLERSFKEFAARPENKPLLEQHQQQEVAAAVELQEQQQLALLQQQVSELDPADAKLLAPVLRSPVLRQLLVSLARDAAAAEAAAAPTAGRGNAATAASGGGLQAWLHNPRVLALLREAARALRAGRLSEQQLAAALSQQARAEQQGQAAGGSEPQAAPNQVLLPSTLLVEALNEHLSERHTGNKAYKQQQWAAALQHYQRALAVVNFVVGRSADEQAEVTANKAAVLLNIAAVHMAQQEWGAAVACCDEALACQAGEEAALKAWLRRSKANLGRHEYEAALQDLEKAQQLEPWHEDIPDLRTAVLHAQRAAAASTDKQLAAKMLRLAS